MNSIFNKYGNYLSAIIQVIMYYFAAQHLTEVYFRFENGFISNVTMIVLIAGPLVVTKYLETKYAQSFIDKVED